MRGKGFINIERACVNKGITLYAHNTLIPTILGGGIAHGVTRIIKDRYKAFQRCFRASLEGFVVYIGSMTNVIKAIQNCTLPHNCGSYLLYQET